MAGIMILGVIVFTPFFQKKDAILNPFALGIITVVCGMFYIGLGHALMVTNGNNIRVYESI